jgi:hypothetical protein
MAQELKLNKEKEHSKPRRSNVHVVEYDSNSLDDENEVYVAEFVWPSKSKASSCASLKLATKGRQEELKFTFAVSKCDRIFDELLKLGNICLHLMKLNDMHIVSFIILILMPLMIAMCFAVRYNRPLMKVV